MIAGLLITLYVSVPFMLVMTNFKGRSKEFSDGRQLVKPATVFAAPEDAIRRVVEEWFMAQSGNAGPYVNIGNPYSELDGGFDLGDLARKIRNVRE